MLRRSALVATVAMLPLLSSAEDDLPTLESWVNDTAATHRYRLDFDGREFSGPAWRRLLSEGRRAQFFLLGEEHGIAENAVFAGQLFTELAGAGYSKFLIEISPPMATVIDETLYEGGLDALRRLYAEPGGEPAFFGMAEEAEMLAAVRAAVPGNEPVLWGADYEVAGDRKLLRELVSKPKPAAAATALDTLIEATQAGWDQHAATGNPEFIFSFAGDPEVVKAVEQAWPDRDAESAAILKALRSTLEINRRWMNGERYASNVLRGENLRDNFLSLWRDARVRGDTPRVMAKFGANHLVRGRNMTQTWDLGSLLPELAALENSRTFSVMVIPGRGSPTAVLNPSTWDYEPMPPKDGYQRGLEPLIGAALSDAFTLIDLEPVRAVVGTNPSAASDALVRVVFGYDMLLVMSGSTASGVFEHD